MNGPTNGLLSCLFEAILQLPEFEAAAAAAAGTGTGSDAVEGRAGGIDV